MSIKKTNEGLQELIEANNGMIKLASHYNEICYYYLHVCNIKNSNENRAEKK